MRAIDSEGGMAMRREREATDGNIVKERATDKMEDTSDKQANVSQQMQDCGKALRVIVKRFKESQA